MAVTETPYKRNLKMPHKTFFTLFIFLAAIAQAADPVSPLEPPYENIFAAAQNGGCGIRAVYSRDG